MYNRKHQMSFKFFTDQKCEDALKEAKLFCESENSYGSRYKRAKHKACFHPWSSEDGSETGYVAIYWN